MILIGDFNIDCAHDYLMREYPLSSVLLVKIKCSELCYIGILLHAYFELIKIIVIHWGQGGDLGMYNPFR